MDTFAVNSEMEAAMFTAARFAFAKANIPHHERGYHYDDAMQEAAIGFLRCDGAPKNYAFAVASRRVIMWVFEFLRQDRSHKAGVVKYPDIIGWEDGAERWHGSLHGDPESMMIAQEDRAEFDQVLEQAGDIILHIMMASRKQQKGRAAEAAVRDTNIILMALDGYSAEGIAQELGIGRADVNSYLSLARKRIDGYLSSLSNLN